MPFAQNVQSMQTAVGKCDKYRRTHRNVCGRRGRTCLPYFIPHREIYTI